MKYGIYIDVFVLTNFCMDYLALFLANTFLGRKQRLHKLIAPALLSAGASLVLLLTLPSYLLYVMMVHALLNPLMAWLAFGKCSWRQFLKILAIIYLAIILLGGTMQWIYQTLFDGQKLWVSIAMSWVIGLVAAYLWEHQSVVGRRIYDVVLRIGQDEISVKAFYDTGNLLMDPYFKQPVNIVSAATVQLYLEKYDIKKRLISFSSLGENNGLMEAVTIEQMLINRGKNVLKIEPAVLGIAGEELLAHKSYQMILNSQLKV